MLLGRLHSSLKSAEVGYNVNMQTGNFGQVREAYAAVRKGVPKEVLDRFWELMPQAHPRILDLGCGTGISTRQLAENAGTIIIGGDIDEKMLEKAREFPQKNIKYVVAEARKLPFASSELDAVTAFSAFHWFRDEESICEIQRVLKPGGIFFVANNNDIGGYRMDFGKKLERLLGRTLPNPKRVYEPDEILRAAGFSHVQKLVVRNDEEFSLEYALLHIQSAGVWNEVPKDKEKEALELMKEHILENKIDGRIVRQVEVQAISGMKK